MKKLEISEEVKQFIITKYQSGEENTVSLEKKLGICNTIIGRKLKEWGVEARNSSDARRKYKVNINYFDTIDTEDKAYFLGLLYADGCNHDSCGNYSIVLSLHEQDKDILEKFQIQLENTRPLYYQPGGIRKNKDGSIKFTYRGAYQLAVSSKYMCERLTELGMTPRKTYTLSFPKFINIELLRHFIRGYFDGDGCIYTYSWKNVEKTTLIFVGSMLFCIELKKFIEETLGIKSFLQKKSNKIGELRIGGLKNSLIFLDYMYKDTEFYIQRKYYIYECVKNYIDVRDIERMEE